MTGSAAPQAGWYPDPSYPTQQWRWWDGVQWSEHTSPMQQAPVVEQQAAAAALQAVPDQQHYAQAQYAAQPAAVAVASAQAVDARFDFDQFVVKQKIRPLLNVYEISAPRAGQPASDKPQNCADICSVRQKRIALRERISMRDGSDNELLALQQRKMLDVKGTSDILDAQGNVLGGLAKDFRKSLLRSRWYVLNAEGKRIAMVEETSAVFAVLRRIGRLIDVVNMVMSFVPYGFTITADGECATYGIKPGAPLGTHNRRIGLRDHYDLDLRNDTTRLIDRRVAVMLAVALDAMQGR